MRIYCDSNIFRKAKKSSSQYFEPIYNTLESLKESFLFLFSEAHLHDLSKSPEKYRDEDLLHMEEYVKNNYLYRDPIKKEFHYYLATPGEAYKGFDFEAMDSALNDPYTYLNSMFDFEGGEIFGNIFKNLFNLPIFGSSDIHIDDSKYPELISGFNNVRTINDALKQLKGINTILDSKKDYKKYRDPIFDFINRDDYSYEKWSFEFNERMKNTAFGKPFTEMVELTIADSDKNDEYTRFINTYTNLEFYGVTQEKTPKKQQLKKNSFWDIHKDAAHAYYASKVDYLVTDDHGLQTKGFITYKLLGIETQVLSVKDFIAKSVFLLKNEDNLNSFYDGITYTLRKGFIINQSVIEDKKVVKLPYPVFNYFNRIQVNIAAENSSIQLFKSYDIKYGIMFAEIDLLIQKCYKIFSQDVDFKSQNNLEEFKSYEDGEFIRKWKYGKTIITLSWEKNTLGQAIIVMTIWF